MIHINYTAVRIAYESLSKEDEAMSKPIDRAYYKKRIAEERARAANASDWAAAAVHRELADLYEELLVSEDNSASLMVAA